MSAIQEFENWYNRLTERDKSNLLSHILETKITSCNEGVYTGPSGMVIKGLFAGPSGNSNSDRCPHCGK